jgi:hypothetical protein
MAIWMRRPYIRYRVFRTLLIEVSRILDSIRNEAAGCGRWHDKDITANGQFLETSKCSLFGRSDEHDCGGYSKGTASFAVFSDRRLLHPNCTPLIWKHWRKFSNNLRAFELLDHF